jgi:PAS domain S-box-containing protein
MGKYLLAFASGSAIIFIVGAVAQKVNILYLEENQKELAALNTLVSREKLTFTITLINNFSDAKKSLEEIQYDVIVSEYSIGNQTVNEILPLIKKVPIIVIGDFSQAKALVGVFQSGASDYLIKDDESLYLQVLIVKVEKLLKTRLLKQFALKTHLDELQYRDITENIPDIVYMIDPNGIFTYLNASARMLGYTPDELVGKHFKEIVHPDDFPAVTRKFALDTKVSFETAEKPVFKFFDERRRGARRTTGLEVRLIPKSWNVNTGDSSVIFASVISFGEISAQGHYQQESNKFMGTVGIIHDITNRKKSEALLRKLFQAVDQSPISIIISDDRGMVEYVNPFFIHISGYEPDDMVGKHLNSLYPCEDGCEPPVDFDKIIKKGEIWHGELKATKKSLEQYWESVMISPILDPSENMTNYLVLKLDISKYKEVQEEMARSKDDLDHEVNERTIELKNALVELKNENDMRRKTEEERSRLQDQLLQSQRLETIGTLAGGIAHDFNNILTPILGYAEMALEEVPLDSSLGASLSRIIQAATRAKDLIQQILTFSRQAEQEKIPVVITPIVKELLKLLRATLPATIDIRHDVESRVDPILIDPIRIYQVLMNLCTNAFHAMRDTGGILDVSLRNIVVTNDLAVGVPSLRIGKYVLLKVSDTGCGMDESTKARIFEPFFTTKKMGEGSGLGLSMVHGIVKSCEGAILVTSAPGKGSIFSIYLPATEYEPTYKTDNHEKIARGNERILLIDDEDQIVIMTKEMLMRIGYNVTALSDSLSALNEFRKNPDGYDIVISDQTMPGMTGMQLANELLKIRKDMPIILTTGYSEGMNEEKAKEAGIRSFVMKPYTFQNLSIIIRQVLDKKR